MGLLEPNVGVPNKKQMRTHLSWPKKKQSRAKIPNNAEER